MSTDALAQLSQRMVSFTMMLLIAVVLLNSLVLFFPTISFSDDLYGISLSLMTRGFLLSMSVCRRCHGGSPQESA